MRFLSSFGRWLKKSLTFQHAAAWGSVFVVVLTIGLIGPTHLLHANTATDFVDAHVGGFLLLLANILQTITGYVAKFALSIIEMLIVPILQYNGFSSSPTIGLGWSLVRDVVNMFVVLVLLVIAIATIVGYEKVHWQKNLPQFLLAVVLVNFSRTICGLLIDISQVVMFTFVNALLDVAAGNFAQLLNFDNYGLYSNSAVVDGATGTSKAIDAGQQLGAAYLLFVLYASILAVLLLLAFVFIWRIIMLWVLVILSPLTFFTWGLGGMFKFAAGSSADWWKKFTSALVLGPMLTFFLWLALSTGSGDIVHDENFPTPDSALSPVLVSFETSNLLATFLGLCLLVVGMQQSAATANSMGGIAKKYLGDPDGGQKLIGRIARAPLQAGREGFRQVDRRAGQATGSSSFTLSKVGHLGDYASAKLSTLPGGGALGRAAANLTGAIQRPIEHEVLEEKKAAKERVSHFTDEQIAQHVRLIADGHTSALGLNAREDIEAIKVKALNDGDFRKKLKKEVGVDNFENLMRDAVNMDDNAIKAAGGDMEKVAKARSQSIHLLKDIDKFAQSDKFDPRNMSEEAAASAAVMRSLEKRYVRTDNNGRDIYTSDELLKGAYGEPLRKAGAGAGLVPEIYDAKTAAEKIAHGDSQVHTDKNRGFHSLRDNVELKSEALAASVQAGRIKLANLSVEDFHGDNGKNLTKALLQTGTMPSRVGAAGDTAVQATYLEQANELLKAGDLDVTETVQVDIANLSGSGDPQEIFGNAEAGTYDADRIQRVLDRQPDLVGKFATAAQSPEVQDAITRAFKVEQVKRTAEQYKSVLSASGKQSIARNVDVIARAYEGAMKRKALGKNASKSYTIVSNAARIVGVKPPAAVDGVGSADADDDDRGTT